MILAVALALAATPFHFPPDPAAVRDAQASLDLQSRGFLKADIDRERIARPASPSRRAQNIVPVYVSRDRLVAIDFLSAEWSGATVTIRYFTVFGRKEGMARRGDLMAGQYIFECAGEPAVRSKLQRLFSFDGKRTLAEPRLDRTPLGAEAGERFRLFQAACYSDRLLPPEGATLIYDLAELYVRRLKRQEIR